MREWLSTWERSFRIEAEELIQEGDRILALLNWPGRGKGSGVEIDDRGAHPWTFRNAGGIARDSVLTRLDIDGRHSLGGVAFARHLGKLLLDPGEVLVAELDLGGRGVLL